MSGGWSRLTRGGAMGGGIADTRQWWRGFALLVLQMLLCEAVILSPLLLAVYLAGGM